MKKLTIKLENVKKTYDGKNYIVKNLNLEFEDGKFVVLVGPSGCGKSTTLRMIAGLESISEGSIYIDGVRSNDLPSKDRDLAMVFQSYALYPHMTIRENISYPLKIRKLDKNYINQKVDEVAQSLGLSELLERKPKELSGGQKQRVALGRCIVRSPKAFLMDEPLSNLDAKLRVQMRVEISRLQKKLNKTFIYVTHDQIEALTMGDLIVVMNDGIIQQKGTGTELYEDPNNKFVADFIGSPSMNFLEFDSNDTRFNGYKHDFKLDRPVYIGFRPEKISFTKKHSDDLEIKSRIEKIENLGSEKYIYLTINDKEVLFRDFSNKEPKTKEEAIFYIDPRDVRIFDKETEERIRR